MGQLPINGQWALCVLGGAELRQLSAVRPIQTPAIPLRDIAAHTGTSGLSTSVFFEMHSLR